MKRSSLTAVMLWSAVGAAGCGDSGVTDGAGGSGGGGATLPLTVDTDHGPVTGVALGTSRVFLGIPYAAPPIDDLRWKPPVDAAPWTDALDATTRGPECPQLAALGGKYVTFADEDCLTINVWTPAKSSTGPRPVLVWIHGGGYVIGSGGDEAYDGQRFSEASDAIVVTFNYRLGPLGFLALPELDGEDAAHPASGAYGLEDQRAALAWVKANAAAFGGDPTRITAFGESAGGASVCQHLVSDKSRGLFQRAIIESGPCDLVASKVDADALGAELTTTLGCDTGDVLACLRGKSAEDVLTAIPVSGDFSGMDGAVWYPAIDGFNLTDAPTKLLDAGSFEVMPTILGTNTDEAAIFFALGDGDVADRTALVAFADAVFPGQGEAIAAEYPEADYPDPKAAAIAMSTDAGFACPTRHMARALDAGGSATFLYHFAFDPGPTLLGDLGVYHSAEIRYVLGNPSQLQPMPLVNAELTMSSDIMGYWSRFAANGDPNSKAAPAWPAFGASDQNLVLDEPVTTESGYLKAKCDFWDTLLYP